MKVVLNKCYGGFGLSLLAQKEYLKRIGKEAYFYKQTKYKHSGGIDEYEKVNCDSSEIMIHAYTKDFGPVMSSYNEDHSWYYGDLKRDDKILVEVVEYLGEKANTWASELKVVDIPDGVEWEISDYDGIETAHEIHNSW